MKSWKNVVSATPEKMAKELAKNYLTAGATKAYLQETEGGFVIEIVDWPSKQLVNFLGYPKNASMIGTSCSSQ